MIKIIAEIGVNHNGCPDLMKELISAAKSSGAHACKFQTFKAERLAKKDTPKVKYQLATSDPDETHWQMLKDLELTEEMHELAIKECDLQGIEFISTPYDPESVEYLNDLGVKTVKTASADVVDHRIHKKIAELNLKPIIAVGMATMDEISQMLKIYSDSNNKPVLLHCVSNYPCSHESINLSCMTLLKQKFECDIGFSDHSIDDSAATLSVALGATVIEKHFTLDKNMEGPDHKASSTPGEFMQLVKSVQKAEMILGTPLKNLQAEEKQMHRVSRKSICLSSDIAKGETLTEDLITMLRPGFGLNGNDFYKVLGCKVKFNLTAGHILSWDDIEDSSYDSH